MGEVYDLDAQRRLRTDPLEHMFEAAHRIYEDQVLELELGQRVVAEMLREVYGAESALHFRIQQSMPAPITELDI